jgi:hypothetical protein
LVGVAIVVGSLASPDDPSVESATHGQELAVTRDKEGKFRVHVRSDTADPISTITLHDKSGREFLVVHLWDCGDFHFNLGDDLPARMVGDIRRKTGRITVAVGTGKAQGELIVGTKSSPNLTVRTLDDPAGPWHTITPRDNRP